MRIGKTPFATSYGLAPKAATRVVASTLSDYRDGVCAMLMKADIGTNENERTFAAWRSMLPHWNAEADRFRKLALAVRAGEPVQLGAFDEAETLVTQVRAAMERADMLMTLTAPGDASLSTLLRASAEFESLLEHYQTTLEMAELVAGRRLRRPVQVITHREAYAG
jgi:hypothetical protein